MCDFRKYGRLASVCVLFLLASCASKPTPVAINPPPPSTPTQTLSTITPGSERDFQVNVGDTVYFDYNRYDLSDADKSLLQRQATWLNKYQSVRITIQGNCDERGTREYNLALGARRANSAKEYLVSLGVSMARIDTISYGKERPICSESAESCWAKNRRAVTVVVSGASS